MHNTFWRRERRMLASLLIGLNSVVAIAGYSNDPDCASVSQSAANKRDRTLGSIDDVAQQTSTAVYRSKTCVDQLIGGTVKSIPSFGGGMVDQIASTLSRSMANQACQLISSSQSQMPQPVQVITGPFPGGPIPGAPIATPGIAYPTQAAPAGGGEPSLWQRMSKMF